MEQVCCSGFWHVFAWRQMCLAYAVSHFQELVHTEDYFNLDPKIMILVQQAGRHYIYLDIYVCIHVYTRICILYIYIYMYINPIMVLVQEAGTGWRRPIGCLWLQVIFRKRATNYRAFLQKMNHKDKASYGSSPPYRHDIYIPLNVPHSLVWGGYGQ